MRSQLASQLARRAKLVVGVAIVFVLATGSVAVGATGAPVFACVNTNNGGVRIVAAGAACRGNEELITLSPDLTGAVALLQQQVAQLQQQMNGILNPPQPVGGTPGASAKVGAPGSPTVSASNFGPFQ